MSRGRHVDVQPVAGEVKAEVRQDEQARTGRLRVITILEFVINNADLLGMI